MNILVTGVAGFLGSHLAEALLNQGHQVIGVDNFLTGSKRNLRYLKHPNFTFIEADVCEKRTWSKDLKLDRIYYLASPASPIDYVDLPFETLFVGSYGCHNYLDLAEKMGARFLLTSTSEIYGDPAIHPQPETYWGNVNPIGPRSVYDEAKRYAEALTMAYHRSKGAQVRIARLFNTYGPRMRHNDGRVIPNFITQALQQKPLTIFGEGKQTRSFCFYSDLIQGLIALMENDQTGPYNLGTLNEMNMLELAETINQLTGNPAGITFKPLPKDDPTRRQPDLRKAERDLAWNPTVSFQDGLKQTVEYFSRRLEEEAALLSIDQ